MTSTNPYFQTASTGQTGQGKKVVVAMSGGVDSSVAAAILKEQGYEVVGIALQTTDYSKYLKNDSGGSCCSAKDMEDARRVAERLHIPFYVLSTEDAFDNAVVDYFVGEYVQGRTPNPCVMCNTKVKFEHLHKKAMDMGADFVATGHYAKLTHEAGLGHCLWKARDEDKDQTYFLFGLTQAKLARAIFPLGSLTKTEVRAMAEKFNLPTAQKPDSQEICFVPGNDYAKFITDRTSVAQRRPGLIVNMQKKVIGEHNGLYNFTIGQRKGLQKYIYPEVLMGLGDDAKVEDLRVLRIDAAKGQVIVGTEKHLFSYGLVARNVNWISPPDLRTPKQFEAKIRYRAPSAACEVRMLGDNAVEVHFVEAQRAISPGQAIVFYDGNLCVGGGWIDSQIKVDEKDRPHFSKSGVSVLTVNQSL